MAATIRLTVLTGPHKGNRFCFREPCGTILGRGSGCDICISGEPRDLCISRQHCKLTFDAPNVEVDDLGSANGTYVNGHPCAAHPSDGVSHEDRIPIDARDGDILTIGGTSLQINLLDCSHWDEGKGIKRNCTAIC